MTIIKITMYEVNFGEEILYQQANSKLLVDCGAKYGRKGKLAYERIKDNIDDNTQLLITHFDEDHYNGILQFPKEFKFLKIYLPLYIFRNKKIHNTEEIFKDIIKTWTYLIAAGKDKKISELHALFLKLPQLVNSVNDIQCVGYGDKLFLGGKKADVLWPAENLELRRRLYSGKVLDILGDNIVGQDVEKLEGIVDAANEYVESFFDVYSFYRL